MTEGVREGGRERQTETETVTERDYVCVRVRARVYGGDDDGLSRYFD